MFPNATVSTEYPIKYTQSSTNEKLNFDQKRLVWQDVWQISWPISGQINYKGSLRAFREKVDRMLNEVLQLLNRIIFASFNNSWASTSFNLPLLTLSFKTFQNCSIGLSSGEQGGRYTGIYIYIYLLNQMRKICFLRTLLKFAVRVEK